MTIRSTTDLPPDELQTDPLRRLVNVFRSRGSYIEADELCALLNEKGRKTDIDRDEVQELAFEWSIDYKPWEDDLHPQDYACYGFEQGYKRALADQRNGNLLPEAHTELQLAINHVNDIQAVVREANKELNSVLTALSRADVAISATLLDNPGG